MVRAYETEDFEKLISLYKNKAAYGGNYDASRDDQKKLLETSRQGNLLVSEIDNIIVGSVMILDNPHTFWLLRFVVDPENRHHDEAAKELDVAVQEVAKSRGHTSVIVYTDPADQPLLNRYRSLAYNESSDYRCFWKGVDDAKMV